MMRDHPEFAAIFGLTGLLCLLLFAVFLVGEIGTSVSAANPVTVTVQPGESLSALSRRLGQQGVLQSPRFFRMLAVLRGDGGRVKAGDYLLKGAVSAGEFLDYLVSGRGKFVALTVPEGFSLRDIADRITEKGIAQGEQFLKLATNQGFINGLALPGNPAPPTVEGFVFPDTYFFHRGMPPPRLIAMMVDAYRKKAHAIAAEGAARVGLTPYQVLILASIIEKETGLGSERRLISAVFHNRLKAGIPLGSDPTVIYGLSSFDGNLTRAHLRQPTKYNTYKITGLPPTPIANPGLESLRAAVNPAQVNYLYFVSKGDGSHFFSTNLKAHNRAVWKYQKSLLRKRKL